MVPVALVDLGDIARVEAFRDGQTDGDLVQVLLEERLQLRRSVLLLQLEELHEALSVPGVWNETHM